MFACSSNSIELSLKREYTIAGLDWWTGPVDWTGGLTFEPILGVLRNSLIIHIMELHIFLVSAACTTATDYNNALHGPLQLHGTTSTMQGILWD